MTTDSRSARQRGTAIEHLAARWLAERGLELIAHSHAVKGGELDLIMRDGPTLVFVEVKHRVDTRHGHPLETITATKQRRIARAAALYLAQHRLTCPCRFDIMAIIGTPPDLHYEWVQAAFDAF